MIEFDETLTKRYYGKEAVMRRIQTRMKHTTYDIPYYQRGLDTTSPSQPPTWAVRRGPMPTPATWPVR